MSFAKCSLEVWRQLQNTSRREEFIAYCNSKYELVPFFAWFLRYFHGNAWPLVVLALLAMPIIFTNVKYIADEFMSKSIMRFQQRFKISALIGAVTLIPLSNAGPDLIVTFVSSQKEQGEDIAMGSLLGAFVFVSTIATGYAVLRSPNATVNVPKGPLFKDIGFYGAGAIMVIVFGLLRRTQRFYHVLPLTLLFAYIATSIYMARREAAEVKEALNASLEESEHKSEAYLDFLSYTWRHLYDPADPLFSVLFLPFKAFYMLTVPYSENPLTRTPLFYLVLAISAALAILGFEVSSNPWVLLGAPAAIAAVVAGLMQVGALKRHRVLFCDFFSLLVSIAFTKVLTDVLLGCINFTSFVLGVNEAYLSMIVLSIGMSISDLFSNAAIAASGHDVMAVMGCISSQIFNLFVGVAGYILFNAKGTFDIFGLAHRGAGPEKGLFVILIAFAFGALTVNFVHISVNNRYRKNFAAYSAVFYVCFLAITAFYSISTDK